MNVLSLFDGISAGQVALERAGIHVDKYYAAEIDKYPIKITMGNYPDTIQLGDVTKWQEWDIDWSSIDLLIGGNPCQSFSVNGNHKGFEDDRGKLFFVYVDILNHIHKVNPNVKFLLENVRMKPEHNKIVDDYLGVEAVRINSSLVSGQMRDRLYWSNFTWKQPKSASDCSVCSMCEEPYCDSCDEHFADCTCIGVHEDDGILTNKDGLVFRLPEDKQITFQSILESDEARLPKAYAITSTYYKKGAEPTRQRNFKRSQRPIAWIDDDNTRWLSVVECERLQTFPDNYTAHVSNTQRYKALGNSWTVDVVAHIFKEGLTND